MVEDTVMLSIEVTTGLLSFIFTGFQVYKIQKEFKKHQKLLSSQEFLRNNNLKSIKDEISKVDASTTRSRMVYVSGQVVSNQFFDNNFKIADNKTQLSQKFKQMLQSGSERQIVFSHNMYCRPTLLNSKRCFDEDYDIQSFRLLDLSPRPGNSNKVENVVCIPSQMTYLQGFRKVKSQNPNEQVPQDLFHRIACTFLLGLGSYSMFNKYSQIIYEGDTLHIFGLLSFNPYADRWEIENPIAFLNGSKDQFIDYLTGLKVQSLFSITVRSIALGVLLSALWWSSKRLFLRLKRNLIQFRNQIRVNRLLKNEQPIAGVPAFVKQVIDKVEIEDFACEMCQNEARDVIFLPCKHCYLCENCYQKKMNKVICERCNGQIKELIKVYVSNNN